MENRSFYERAVLNGMFNYNDMRPVEYLKPSNFKDKSGDVENSKIFEVLCNTMDFHERLKAFRRLGSMVCIYTEILRDKDIQFDYFGVNTPKYCLLILEDIFEEAVRERLKSLSIMNTLYGQIIQNVYAEIELSDMDCFEMAENVLAYFRSIGFEKGVLSFEELNQNIDERVKSINQNYEVDMLTTRLKRYCDDAGKRDYILYLDTIKHGITA